MIYTYPNINAPDCDAGVVHWYLKLNLQEPTSVTVSPTDILVEYATTLTAMQKATLDSIMATPITWRFIDYTIPLSIAKLQDLLTTLLGFAPIFIDISPDGILLRLDRPLTETETSNIQLKIGAVTISSIMV